MVDNVKPQTKKLTSGCRFSSGKSKALRWLFVKGLVLLSLTRCQTQHLGTAELTQSPARANLSWQKKLCTLDDVKRISGKDEWPSWMARSLLPVDRRVTPFQAKVTKAVSQYEFVLQENNTKTNVDLIQAKTGLAPSAKDIGGWDAVYYESLDYYIRLIPHIRQLSFYQKAKSSFFAFVDPKLSFEGDQVVVSLTMDNTIEHIQFTYRDLGGWYLGYLIVKEWETESDCRRPRVINIQSRPDGPNFDHRITLRYASY